MDGCLSYRTVQTSKHRQTRKGSPTVGFRVEDLGLEDQVSGCLPAPDVAWDMEPREWSCSTKIAVPQTVSITRCPVFPF